MHDDGATFAVMEESPEQEAVLWQRDRSRLDVRVGERFAIVRPKIVGKFPNGEYIIHTILPFEMLVSPALPTVETNFTESDTNMQFYIYNKLHMVCTPPLRLRVSAVVPAVTGLR